MGGKSPKKLTPVSKNSDKLPLGHANRSEDPLSNYVVLQNIFSYLDNTDIGSCSQVNKCWNSIADPLFVKYYNLTLEKTYNTSTRTHCASVFISKPSRYDSKRIEGFSASLKDAAKFLETAAKAQKIPINCSMSSCDENEEIVDFLSKFGHLAQILFVSNGVTTGTLCKTLARFFPNLKELDLSEVFIKKPDDLSFDENLMENCMKNLKRIHEYDQNHGPKVHSWINIFRMTPNLEEIQAFAILHVDALIASGKSRCVRSLIYPDGELDEDFRNALEKLANLDLKLKAFDFCHYGSWPRSFCTPQIQPFVRKILDSSSGSLESLRLYRTETFDFQSISPMIALKTVKFLPTDANRNWRIKFFSPEIILSNVFPQVSNVEILTSLLVHPVSHVARWFPEHQFAPWGVRKLKIEDASLSILEVMSRAFPALTELELRMENGGLQQLIRAICDLWPEIELLTIRVPESSEYEATEDDWSFDSVFTGIAKEDLVLFEGTDPLALDTLFSTYVQEYWKQRSPLRNLSSKERLLLMFGISDEGASLGFVSDVVDCIELKVLKFDLTGGFFWEQKFMQRLSTVTRISKEFGFNCLPELQIVVRTSRNEDCENWPKGAYDLYILFF